MRGRPRKGFLPSARAGTSVSSAWCPAWTTEGEAQEIGRRAARFGWRHIIVVTYTPHVSRARYIVSKCFDGELTMVASPSATGPRFWTWMYIRQSAGYLRALLSPGC